MRPYSIFFRDRRLGVTHEVTQTLDPRFSLVLQKGNIGGDELLEVVEHALEQRLEVRGGLIDARKLLLERGDLALLRAELALEMSVVALGDIRVRERPRVARASVLRGH